MSSSGVIGVMCISCSGIICWSRSACSNRLLESSAGSEKRSALLAAEPAAAAAAAAAAKLVNPPSVQIDGMCLIIITQRFISEKAGRRQKHGITLITQGFRHPKIN